MPKRGRPLDRTVFLAALVLPLAFLSACGGTTSSVATCPSYVVTPDAGVTGFGSVGEWHDDAVCAQYCESGYTVCQQNSATTVKCQKGCD